MSRGKAAADRARALAGAWAGFVDFSVAVVLSVGSLIELTPASSRILTILAVALALYRIVQEALTNVVKHASSAPTEIRVAFEAGEVDVQVTNASSPPGVTERRPARSGHGLVGMRERVDACGGALWHGSRNDGGYEVHARLPVTRPRPEQTRSRPGSARFRVGVGMAGAAGWLHLEVAPL